MAPYMAKHGELSHHMMKKTASIQVSVDYSDEEDFTRKMRTALYLVPIMTAIFANSPISEAKINGFLSERAHIWNYTDSTRSGLIEERFFSNPQFSSYVDYALEVPMFFIIRDNRWVEVKKRTFSQYLKKGYQGYKASWDDWELHLSTIFTEVRVKSYIELRCTDSQRVQLTPAVVAAWKGILYNQEAIRAVWSLMKGLSWAELRNLYLTVPREGLRAELKGVRLLDLAKEIIKISHSGLKEQQQFNQDGKDESVYLEPIMELIIEDEMCPAEIIIKNWNSSWHRSIDKLIEYSSY
jgi:glutamate--cysteine ligase